MESHRRRGSGAAALFAKYPFSSGRYSCYPTPAQFAQRVSGAELGEALAARARMAARRPIALAVHLDARDLAPTQCVEAIRIEAAMLKALAGSEPAGAIGFHRPGAALVAHASFRPMLDFVRGTFGAEDADCLLELDAKHATKSTVAAVAAARFDRVRLRCADRRDETRFAEALERIADTLDVRVDASLSHGESELDAERFAALVELAARHGSRCIVLAGAERGPGRPRESDAALLAGAIEALCDAGYENAGFDVFVRGGAPGGSPFHLRFDLLGIGTGAVTACGEWYAMNEAATAPHTAALSAGRLPVARGHRMSAEDLVRRDIIHSLECLGNVSFSSIEFRHGIDFRRHFAREIGLLEEMQADGLVELYEDAIDVTAEGRPLVRLAAAAFDQYLGRGAAIDSEKTRAANSLL